MQAARIDVGVVQHTLKRPAGLADLAAPDDAENGTFARDTVIVGTDSHAIGLANTFQRNPKLGCRVIGLVGPDLNAAHGKVEVLGPIGDLDEILQREKANGVVMSRASLDDETVKVLARQLTDAGYHVALSSHLPDINVIRTGWRTLAKRALGQETLGRARRKLARRSAS